MDFDFERELGRLRPAPVPLEVEAALEAALEGAFLEEELAEGEAWSLLDLEGLEPARPRLGVEEALEVELSRDVHFEEWLRVLSPAPGTAALEEHIARELQAEPPVADAVVAGGETMPAKVSVRRGVTVRRGVIFTLTAAAAAVVACAYLAGMWSGVRVGRGVVAAADEEGFRGSVLKRSAFGGGVAPEAGLALSLKDGRSQAPASFAQGVKSGEGVSRGLVPGRNRNGQVGTAGGVAPERGVGGVAPVLAVEGGRRPGDGGGKTLGQGGSGDFAGAETHRLGSQAGEGGVLGPAWGPLSLVRSSAQEVAQGASTGSSGESSSKHSPLLEALADGRVFEALPSALKLQIQGWGDVVSVALASKTNMPVVGASVVGATTSVSVAGGEPSPSANSSVSPMGFAGGTPPGTGVGGMPPPLLNAVPLGTRPVLPVFLGDSGTGQSEDVSGAAVVAGGTGGSGGIVLQSTGTGYEAADEVVVLTLRTDGAGVHAQVSSRDGTLLSERPILNGDSFRTLGQQAKQELTVTPPVKGE